MKLKKGWKIAISGILIVAIAGTGIFYAGGGFQAGGAAAETSYQVTKVTTGDLKKSITASGTLSAQSSTAETAELALTLGTVYIEAGQTVAEGDPVAEVDKSALSDTILTLQSELSDLDTSLAQEAAAKENTATVKSQVAGRVKKVLAAKGDNVSDVIGNEGGLLLLSTDGRMKINCKLDTPSSLDQGDSVTVKIGSSSYTGLVGSVAADGASCTVTLADNGPKLEAKAVIYQNGNRMGEGVLEINQPYYVPADGGIVSKVYVSLNQKITTSTSLFYLKSIAVSDTYTAQLAQRSEKLALLYEAKAIGDSGVLLAKNAGIVSEVSVTAGQVIEDGTQLYTLLKGGATKLVVNVDELDIGSIKEGQTATVAVDAFSDNTYQATVEGYSKVGTNSNGVTTYSVTLAMEEDDALLVGMNATANIVIEEKTGVLLLPLEALQSLRGEQYVWLYTGELPADSSADPGTRTVVTTGLSDDNNVEITSGLSEEDQVLIVRTKSTSSTSSNWQTGGMNFAGMGGDRTSGMGDQRPSGMGSVPN